MYNVRVDGVHNNVVKDLVGSLGLGSNVCCVGDNCDSCLEVYDLRGMCELDMFKYLLMVKLRADGYPIYHVNSSGDVDMTLVCLKDIESINSRYEGFNLEELADLVDYLGVRGFLETLLPYGKSTRVYKAIGDHIGIKFRRAKRDFEQGRIDRSEYVKLLGSYYMEFDTLVRTYGDVRDLEDEDLDKIEILKDEIAEYTADPTSLI